MRRYLWVVVLGAGVIGFEFALFKLARIGTCASGGPYVIGSECPAGTNWWIAMLIGSIFVIAASTFLIPAGTGHEKGEGRPWLPALAFIPATKESAVFAPLTAAVLVAESQSTGTLIAAGVLLLGGPIAWVAMRWFMADTDRVLAERRRKRLKGG